MECLRHLPQDAAKTARLVCHQWSSVIARQLFRRIYFRPHTQIMEVFEAITSNPLFAVGVQELVYDARLFLAYSSSPGAYMRAYDKYFDIGMDEHPDENEDYDWYLAESEERHDWLRQEQQRILDQHIDRKILSAGLEQLPNLRTVSVLDQFTPVAGLFQKRSRSPADLVSGGEGSLTWYYTWSSKFWGGGGVIGPGGGIDLEGLGEEYAWDPRGINRFLDLVSTRSPPLTHLKSCCHHQDFPLRLLASNSLSPQSSEVARSLRCISISSSSGDIEAPARLTILPDAVKYAQNLQCLSLSIDCAADTDWGTHFSSAHWPHLTFLNLNHSLLHPNVLASICFDHKDTLRSLKLSYVTLNGIGRRNAWKDVAEQLIQDLRLHHLYLGKLALRGYKGNPQAREMRPGPIEALGCRLMQWNPYDRPHKAYDLMWHFWYGTEFTPPSPSYDNYHSCGCHSSPLSNPNFGRQVSRK